MNTVLRFARRLTWTSLLALPLLPLATGCSRVSKASTPPPETTTDKARGETVHPTRETLWHVVQQPGQIEGIEQTPLYAKVAGYVDWWKSDMGDRVTKDQVLAKLRVPELVEELREKEAVVFQRAAEVIQAERMQQAADANLKKAEAVVSLALATQTRAEASLVRWKSEFERNTRLLGTGSVDRQTLEQTADQLGSAEAAQGEAVAAIASARAAKEESAAQLAKAKADVEVAKAKASVSAADRDRTGEMLKYTEIKAPFDGIVTMRNVDTGRFVQAAGAGQALYVVVRTDPVRVFVDVPQADASRVVLGMAATVLVPSADEREFTGQVTRASWVLDNQTRTLRTQIDLPNRDGTLRPGTYSSARLKVRYPNVWAVPSSAVWTQDDQPVVALVVDGKIVRTPVKVGLRQGQFVQLLKKQSQRLTRDEPGDWQDFDGTETMILNNPSAIEDGSPSK